MTISLTDIEGVEPQGHHRHPVKALVIDGKSPVRDELAYWHDRECADYKKIMKVMQLVACNERVRNEIHVTKDAEDSELYEMRAHRGRARVFFFYAKDEEDTVICLATFWKAGPMRGQKTALKRARLLKELCKEHFRGKRKQR